MNPAEFDRAVARLPIWILALAVIGAALAGTSFGLRYAGGFLIGAIAAYFNFRIIERAVNRVSRLAESGASARAHRTGLSLLIQFGIFVLGAFVILELSGFNLAAAFCGFLVCPAAVIVEIVYELIRYGHS